MIDKAIVRTAIVAILVWFTSGCAGTQQVRKAESTDTDDDPMIQTGINQDEHDTSYQLTSGDVIDVKFFYTPNLNETLTIRPDGKISLQLVDDIQAAGLTPSELDDILTSRYSSELLQPEIVVIVKTFSGHKVYVGGEVKNPNVIQLTGGLSVLQAIFNAGGYTDNAKLKNVIIIRKGDEETPVKYLTVDLKSVLSKGKGEDDILLKPFDVVFVPKTTIAKVDLFVSQYFNQAIPAVVQQWFFIKALQNNRE